MPPTVATRELQHYTHTIHNTFHTYTSEYRIGSGFYLLEILILGEGGTFLSEESISEGLLICGTTCMSLPKHSFPTRWKHVEVAAGKVAKIRYLPPKYRAKQFPNDFYTSGDALQILEA